MTKKMAKMNLGASLLLLALLAGCATSIQTPASTPSDAPAAPTAIAEPTAPAGTVPTDTTGITDTATVTEGVEPGIGSGAEPIALPDTGAAVVENVDVRILESFPVQVQVVVTGYLPDGCTTITGVDAVNDGNTFRIRITTERPADAMCTQAIMRFEEVVPLETTGLDAGTYQVVVNDLSVSFELPGGADASSQPEAGAFPVVETETGFVMAQVDVPIYDAPQEGATEIGMIAGGQTARVTGASPDGAWWRVICPDDSVGDCWVSAAPEMTVPTSPSS